MKRRKPLKPVSDKRSAEWPIYLKLKRGFLKRNLLCQRAGCTALCTQVHHWAGRRSNFLKVETWRASCDACNLWAKNNPAAARSEGWIAPVGVYLT